MVVIDETTRMTHLIPCDKSVTTTQIAGLCLRHVIKHHCLPQIIYTYRGARFVSKPCREPLKVLGTSLKYNTAFHTQMYGMVERMNAVVGQMLRCSIHKVNEIKNWK